MWSLHRVLGLTAPLAVACVTGVAAQVTDACPVGQIEVGTIGVGELQCENCRVGIYVSEDSGVGRRMWDFRSEPRIGRIVVGGPAAGRLQAGDIITTIDGQLITTREGGVRYGALVPGRPVTLGIRRDDREFDVTVTPVARCVRVNVPEAPPAPTPPRPTVAPRTDVPVRPEPPAPVGAPRPLAPPRPWPVTPALGFSIRCTECSLQRLDDPERWIWSFSEPPVIERVEPNSAAYDAGLRAGDVLTHIDGHRLATAEGGQRFGAIEAGDSVTLTYRRGAQERTATLVAREVAGRGVLVRREPGVPTPAPSAQSEVTRFSGSLGDAVIQVTGGRVTVTRTDDEIVIQSSDITVRIKRSGER